MSRVALAPFIASRAVLYGLTISPNEVLDEAPRPGLPPPGELVLLGVYWYCVREDGCLSCAGRTSLYTKSSAQARDAASDSDVRADAAVVTGTEISAARVVGSIMYAGTAIERVRLSELYRPGAEGEPREGNYIHIADGLYLVGNSGNLKPLGVYHVETFNDLAAGFTRLTGYLVSDYDAMVQMSDTVASGPEEIERFFQSMPKREQERFVQECRRLFGSPLND